MTHTHDAGSYAASPQIGTMLGTIVDHAERNDGYLAVRYDGASGWVLEYGYGDPWVPASRQHERFGVAFNSVDLNDALMQVVGGLPDVAVCTHCQQRIAKAEEGWMHLTGRHHGRRSCSPEESHRPYGLAAAPNPDGCAVGCLCRVWEAAATKECRCTGVCWCGVATPSARPRGVLRWLRRRG